MTTTHRSPNPGAEPARRAAAISHADAAADDFKPIGDYGLFADCNSAALVDRDGSISWLCLPRYDSPALFARILDPDGGHWSIAPTAPYRSERRYLPGRAVALASALGEHADVERWSTERDEIRAAVLTRGWSEARQAYAQSFDSDELDAAQLLMPILGFLPATDERMRSTIDAIASELTEDGLVLRYRNAPGLNADGLSGEEGTFVICSFWLVSALAKAGEVDRAQALFDQLVGYANDLGLLAEEIDTGRGELLGNFPQAFSHIGLITAAWEIDQARGRVG